MATSLSDRILYCGCSSDAHGNKSAAMFQDNLYGAYKRLYTQNSTNNGPCRCTVCGKKVGSSVKK